VPKNDDSTNRNVAIRRERNWIHESVVSVTRGRVRTKTLARRDWPTCWGGPKRDRDLENLRRDLGVADFICWQRRSRWIHETCSPLSCFTFASAKWAQASRQMNLRRLDPLLPMSALRPRSPNDRGPSPSCHVGCVRKSEDER